MIDSRCIRDLAATQRAENRLPIESDEPSETPVAVFEVTGKLSVGGLRETRRGVICFDAIPIQ